MLKRHNAYSVSVPLGAYGGASEPLVIKWWEVLGHVNMHAYMDQCVASVWKIETLAKSC